MANGFTFDGIHCGAYGIAMLSKNRPILPGNNDSYIDVPGRNGSIHIPQGLQDRIIELECGFVETSIANLRTAARSIAAWLYTEERAALSFDDEPGKTYQAKLESAVDLEQAFVLGRFTLSFRCDPLAYGTEQTDSFVSDIVTANNTGTFEAYPTFTSTFTDSATEWKVTLGTAYCRVVNNFVSSDVLVVNLGTGAITLNGTRSMSLLDYQNSQFFALSPGTNEISIAPTGKCSTLVKHTPKWL